MQQLIDLINDHVSKGLTNGWFRVITVQCDRPQYFYYDVIDDVVLVKSTQWQESKGLPLSDFLRSTNVLKILFINGEKYEK